jgi:hypothetical protein
MCGALSGVVALPAFLAVQTVTVSPAVLTGAAGATATVTLDGLAPVLGTSVFVSSSQPSVATVPAKFPIPAGRRSGTVAVTTSSGNGGCSTISARVAGGNETPMALISVRPTNTNASGPMRLTLADSVVGGGSLQGFVILRPSGAVPGTVQLTSSNPAVNVPATVSATNVTEVGIVTPFNVTTSAVQYPGSCAVITATKGTLQTRILLRVMPIGHP